MKYLRETLRDKENAKSMQNKTAKTLVKHRLEKK